MSSTAARCSPTDDDDISCTHIFSSVCCWSTHHRTCIAEYVSITSGADATAHATHTDLFRSLVISFGLAECVAAGALSIYDST